jgi:hypothetical protein
VRHLHELDHWTNPQRFTVLRDAFSERNLACLPMQNIALALISDKDTQRIDPAE